MSIGQAITTGKQKDCSDVLPSHSHTPEFVMAIFAPWYMRLRLRVSQKLFFPFFLFLILGEPDLRGTGLPPATNNVETRGREEHYGQRSHQERFGLIQFRFLNRIFCCIAWRRWKTKGLNLVSIELIYLLRIPTFPSTTRKITICFGFFSQSEHLLLLQQPL